MSGGNGAPGNEGGAPAKRKVVDLEPGAEVEVVEKGGFTLAALQSTLQTELRANREDIKQAVGGVQKEMVERIATVETEVTRQLKNHFAAPPRAHGQAGQARGGDRGAPGRPERPGKQNGGHHGESGEAGDESPARGPVSPKHHHNGAW